MQQAMVQPPRECPARLARILDGELREQGAVDGVGYLDLLLEVPDLFLELGQTRPSTGSDHRCWLPGQRRRRASITSDHPSQGGVRAS